MPVESIHHFVAFAYLLMWVFISHITMGRRPRAESDTIQTPSG